MCVNAFARVNCGAGCNDAVTKELFDCVDNPLLEKERTKILEMRHDCQPGSSGGRAGDGKCDFLAISKYEKEQKASGKEPDCGSNEVKEEFDCIDGTAICETTR